MNCIDADNRRGIKLQFEKGVLHSFTREKFFLFPFLSVNLADFYRKHANNSFRALFYFFLFRQFDRIVSLMRRKDRARAVDGARHGGQSAHGS